METITLRGEQRTVVGTRAARALRQTGMIPAVIYGHGETPESVSLSRHDMEVALAHGARMLQVELAGQPKSFLIKEVQYDHLDQAPVHLDLMRVDLHERVKVRVGIELVGTPKGVAEGGFLEQHLADIEVECLAGAIPATLRPVVLDLHVGDSLLVKNLQLPAGVVALADPGDRVASVRAVVEKPEEEVAPGAAETAEPELIGRVRKEETKEE